MNTTRTIVASAALACFLAGCNVGPNYVAPAIHAPQGWTEPATAEAAADGAWWRTFNDPQLDTLVARAAAANTDIRVAIARLREARARRGVVSSALYPHVDVNGSFSNSRFSENGFLQGFPAGGSSGLPGAVGPGQEINLYQASLDASWEIDIFGGVRRSVEEADANIVAAEFDTGDVIRSVVAEVADGYVQLRGLQTRLEIARNTAETQQKSFEIIREQVGAGVGNDFDLARAESQAATSRAEVPGLEAAVRVAVRRLEVLLGAMPGTLDAELVAHADVPKAPDALAVGIPSDVLRRRPDIRAAERRLAASTARVGVATADLFPRFSLTGSFGLQSQKIEDLPNGDSRFWLVGPAVRWPLLDFGRVRSNIAVENARTQEAEATYEGTIIQALSDVEVAMVRLSREKLRSAELDQAAAAADRSLHIAEDRYHNGVLEYTDLLDAQRTQNSARDAAAQSHTAVSSATVALFKALGGGWTDVRVVESGGTPHAG
jgi:NodT family efflux transporter outer membrane factor (OMF) lipoprotein